MQPELVAALVRLRDAGTIPAPTAAHLLRIARGELVSVHSELRLALYAGVLAVAAGVGTLVQQQLDHIGPLAVALAMAAASVACFWWVARHAPPFTRGRANSSHLAFDYILLLATLLAAADLGYIEAHFTPLGQAWPWHLLLVALAAAAIAARYDSRVVLSLALSCFAAWRGVAISLSPHSLWDFRYAPGAMRLNALECGLLFLLVGRVLLRFDLKAHFEPVAVTAGAFLGSAALASGVDAHSPAGLGWTILSLCLGTGLLAWGWQARRFLLLATGLLDGHVGLTSLFFRLEPANTIAAGWFLLTSVALVLGLVLIHRRLREEL